MRQKIHNLRSTNPKEYWKIINSGRKQISPNISINVLFDFFKTLNTGEPENEGDPPVFNQDTDDLNNIINAPITIDEIKSAMKNLKNNKASGEDLIANEYLKHSFEIMSDIYVKLFNLIFDKGLIPEQWLYGDIIPIFKNKGDKSDPKNYRPITIVSCFGKLFTSVLNNRLNKFSDQYHVILENLGGFRKGYSTNDNLFILHILIHIMKKKKKKLYCAFIDFAKAFDTVWRNGLWNKLLINQINGKMYNVIFNMYQNIKSRIQYNKETSNYFECNVGVRQGENLQPFLFSLYLNDLEHFLQSKNSLGLNCITDEIENELDIFIKMLVILYTDDTVLFADSAVEMHIQLDNFSEYCSLWKLNVNSSKTKVVIFAGGRFPTNNFNFNFDGNNLEIVSDIVYLGVNFSRTGSYLNTKKRNIDKDYKAIYAVLKKGRLHNLSIKCQYDLFDKIVKPILLYGCEIWGFSNLDTIERVHLKFCKLLLHLKKSTPNFMIYGELGACPMSVYIQTRIVHFWSKLVNCENSKLSSIIYKYAYLQHTQNGLEMPWIKAVKNILDSCGFSNIWENQGNFNSKWLSLSLKQKLFDQFQQKWRSDMNNSSKGLCYKIFKDCFEFENYLNLLDDKDRQILCKFRTCNHRLPIAIGR